jgi:hypothetical protein
LSNLLGAVEIRELATSIDLKPTKEAWAKLCSMMPIPVAKL